MARFSIRYGVDRIRVNGTKDIFCFRFNPSMIFQASSGNERSTWLTHIQEASNAYKSREPRFRNVASASNISFVQNRQQIFENNINNMDMTDRRGTGRSLSFNEQSLRYRELQNRPLPEPPIEKGIFLFFDTFIIQPHSCKEN